MSLKQFAQRLFGAGCLMVYVLAAAPGAALAAADSAPAGPGAVPAGRTGPPGWLCKGDQADKFDMGVDKSMMHDGKPCAFIKSKIDKVDGLGTMRQAISSKNYIGKRIRLSGWLKTEGVKDSAGLWMRVDGPDHKMIEFDNMENRPVVGTNDWKQYSVVLDVPKEAEAIYFGFLLFDAGRVWASDLKLQVVDKNVASTNMVGSQQLFPDEPVNMDFSDNGKD